MDTASVVNIETITRIPEKPECTPYIRCFSHQIGFERLPSNCPPYPGARDEIEEEFQITIGLRGSKTQKGELYRTFALGVIVKDDEDYRLLQAILEQWALHQMKEDAKIGELISRAYPQTYYDKSERTVFVSMRYYVRKHTEE